MSDETPVVEQPGGRMTRDDLVQRLLKRASECHEGANHYDDTGNPSLAALKREDEALLREAAAAALAAPPAAPPADLVALGDRLRTQDNQMTAHPIFVVEHRDDNRRPWEFVTACLTDDGARSYMKANGHNLRKFSRIFVHSGYRNDEWIGLLNYFLSLHAAPRVPDTPQGYSDTRCADCSHDADRHFNGGRCMHVPCMCAEWQQQPAPPQEPPR